MGVLTMKLVSVEEKAFVGITTDSFYRNPLVEAFLLPSAGLQERQR
jgi:hypothetical protein